MKTLQKVHTSLLISLAINYNNGILIAGGRDKSFSVWKSNMSNKVDEVDFTLQFRRENAHNNSCINSVDITQMNNNQKK